LITLGKLDYNHKMKECFDYDCTLLEMRSTKSMAEIGSLLGISGDAVSKLLIAGRNPYLKEIEGVWHQRQVSDWRHGPRESK